MALSDKLPTSVTRTLSSWVLFQRERQRLPSMVGAFPEILEQNLTLHDTAKNLGMYPTLDKISQSGLSVTEYVGEGWRTGSVWFLKKRGRLTSLVPNDRCEFIPIETQSHTRFAVYEVDRRSTLFITFNGDEEGLRFLKIHELDGGKVMYTNGFLNRFTGALMSSNDEVGFKYCPFCVTRDSVCTCAPTFTEPFFERELWLRQQRYRQSANLVGASSNKYTRECFSGRWLFQANGQPAATIQINLYFSGSVLQNCLSRVIQSEMEVILQPSLGLLSKEDILSDLVPSSLSRGKRSTNTATISDTTEQEESRSGCCPICGTIIKRKYDIQRHIRCVHERVREHRCTMCSQAFLQRSHLKDHIRGAHTKSSENMCSVCGKRFGMASKLKRHVATVHENVRNFSCPHCTKSYKDKKALKYHLDKNHSNPT